MMSLWKSKEYHYYIQSLSSRKKHDKNVHCAAKMYLKESIVCTGINAKGTNYILHICPENLCVSTACDKKKSECPVLVQMQN